MVSSSKRVHEWLNARIPFRMVTPVHRRPIALPANGVDVPLMGSSRLGGEEGTIWNILAFFEHPYCGIRVEMAHYDSEHNTRVDLLQLFGLTTPNEHMWVINPSPNRYTLCIVEEIEWNDWVRICAFNDDFNLHNLLAYSLHIAYAPKIKRKYSNISTTDNPKLSESSDIEG